MTQRGTKWTFSTEQKPASQPTRDRQPCYHTDQKTGIRGSTNLQLNNAWLVNG